MACEAGEAAYIGLLRKLGKVDRVTGLVPTGRELFESPDTLNDADRKEWRIWFRHVFQPLDEVRELLILNSAYLAREAQIPPCLLQLVAYASQSKALVCKWDEDDFSEHVVATDFPADLSRYAADGYNELSKQRQELQEASTWRRLIGARDTVQQ